MYVVAETAAHGHPCHRYGESNLYYLVTDYFLFACTCLGHLLGP